MGVTCPIHDWTRVTAGIFHSFHLSWTDELMAALNAGVLPPDHYALAEQVVGEFGPDVLALKFTGPEADPSAGLKDQATVAVAPPKVRFTARSEMELYAQKQRTIVIRHSSGDQVVALVEIVSQGNKANKRGLRSFVQKAAAALYHGYHLLILDVQPATKRDPQGIHGAIWEEIEDVSADKPLTLVAYEAGSPKTAYVEPVAVGDPMPDMPVSLRPGGYVNVPLEATYMRAFAKVPLRWRRVLEG